MYFREDPTALIISIIGKSIWAINVVKKGQEVTLHTEGKVAYSLWLEGSMLEPASQQLAELAKFPGHACYSLNTFSRV